MNKLEKFERRNGLRILKRIYSHLLNTYAVDNSRKVHVLARRVVRITDYMHGHGVEHTWIFRMVTTKEMM